MSQKEETSPLDKHQSQTLQRVPDLVHTRAPLSQLSWSMLTTLSKQSVGTYHWGKWAHMQLVKEHFGTQSSQLAEPFTEEGNFELEIVDATVTLQ